MDQHTPIKGSGPVVYTPGLPDPHNPSQFSLVKGTPEVRVTAEQASTQRCRLGFYHAHHCSSSLLQQEHNLLQEVQPNALRFPEVLFWSVGTSWNTAAGISSRGLWWCCLMSSQLVSCTRHHINQDGMRFISQESSGIIPYHTIPFLFEIYNYKTYRLPFATEYITNIHKYLLTSLFNVFT
jgi:hypothetical protein